MLGGLSELERQSGWSAVVGPSCLACAGSTNSWFTPWYVHDRGGFGIYVSARPYILSNVSTRLAISTRHKAQSQYFNKKVYDIESPGSAEDIGYCGDAPSTICQANPDDAM